GIVTGRDTLLSTQELTEANRELVTVRLKRQEAEARVNEIRANPNAVSDVLTSVLIHPLMYVMHGTVIAGQLGVTWQLAEAVASIASAIVFSRFPEFSRLAGTRSSRELDGLFLSTSGISMALCFLGALGVSLGVLLLQESGFQVANRM